MTTSITTRAGKGSELTWNEVDANFTNLQTTADAAATLGANVFTDTQEIRNGTTEQTVKVYGTYTDSSNYVRASLAATSTAVTLAAETAGTGADNIDVTLTPAGNGVVNAGYSKVYGGAFVTTGSNVLVDWNAATVSTSYVINWSTSGYALSGAYDLGISKSAAGVLEVNSGTAGTLRDVTLRNVVGQIGYHEMTEMTAPGAGASNTARIYAEDNGAGKTRLMVQFASGAAQQIAIEP